MATDRGPSAICTGVRLSETGEVTLIERNSRQSFRDQLSVFLHLTGPVAGSRPEEPPQSITLGSGHHVYVKVRDGLADDVIDCHERALRT